jgi:glycerol-3-phosphate acyltransferase PlsY
MTELIVKMLLAYLLGSVSGSLLLGKLKKVDIRSFGSGNAGATNAFRLQGPWFALAVIVIDISKGVLAVGWIPLLPLSGVESAVPANVLVLACGFAAVLGHCFPLWHGFRGGKGAATAIGTLFVIESWLLLPVIIAWLLVLIVTGYVGLATVLASFSLVPVVWFMGDKHLLIYVSLIALFLLYTHRSNIRNLRKGTEHQFETKRLFSRKNR